MNQKIAIVGMGQLGGVFAHGLLRRGHTIVPVVRSMDLRRQLDQHEPSWVLVTVGEGDLDPVLAGMPTAYGQGIGLCQNELLPSSWAAHQVTDPTVAVVWFEKKASTPIKPVRSTGVAGPRRGLLLGGMEALGIPCHAIEDPDALCFELVAKNVYILTVNIAGLMVGGTTGALFHDHRELAVEVARDAIALQRKLVGGASASLDDDALLRHLEGSAMADPAHACKGRSAPARLERALAQAAAQGVDVPRMRDVDAALRAGRGA